MVVDAQVRPLGRVEDAGVDGQDGGNVAGDGAVGRGGQRQHDRAAQPRDHAAERVVGGPVARLRQADVVRLVDDDEADAARFRQVVGVDVQKLGRGQHDVDLAGGKALVDGAALFGRRLAREHGHGNAEARKRRI